MNKKCVAKIDAILDTFGALIEGLETLKTAIETDNEAAEVEEALDMFPTPKQLSKDLESLGTLMETHPWEKGKKA